jgi:hypothetical protein
MDQRSIILYLARKGLSVVATHDNLVTTFDLQNPFLQDENGEMVAKTKAIPSSKLQMPNRQ